LEKTELNGQIYEYETYLKKLKYRDENGNMLPNI